MVGLALPALRLKPLAFDDDVSVLAMTRHRDIKLARVGLLRDVDDARRSGPALGRVNRSGVGVNDLGGDVFLPGRSRANSRQSPSMRRPPEERRQSRRRRLGLAERVDRGAIAVAVANRGRLSPI